MKKDKLGKLFGVALLLAIIGSIGHTFFFWVQENFYGDPNFLKPISDALNDQTSATTYFVVLSMTGCGMMFFFIISQVIEIIETRLFSILVYVLPILAALVYTYYEYKQMLNPTYVDNHILDFVLAWAACLTFLLGMTWGKK